MGVASKWEKENVRGRKLNPHHSPVLTGACPCSPHAPYFKMSCVIISGKELACQCRKPKRHRFNPWVGKILPEEGMATHYSIVAWRIPWTEEPGGLQFMGLQRETRLSTHAQVTNSFPGRLLWCRSSFHCARLHLKSRADGHQIPEHGDSSCGDLGQLLSKQRTPSKWFVLPGAFDLSTFWRAWECTLSILISEMTNELVRSLSW